MWKHKLVLVYIYDPATLALIKCAFSKKIFIFLKNVLHASFCKFSEWIIA